MKRLAWQRYVLMLAGFGVTIALWQITSWLPLGIYQRFVSSPTRVASAFLELWQSGILGWHIGESLKALILGLVLVIPPGIVAGFIFGRFPALEEFAYLWIYAVAGLPGTITALAAIVIFGTGLAAKLFVISWGALLATITTTLAVYRVVDERLQAEKEAAVVEGAASWQVLGYILLPNMWTGIFIGIRQGISRGFRALIHFEVLVTAVGLGSLAATFINTFQLDRFYASAFVILLLTTLLLILGEPLEQKYRSKNKG